MSSVPVKRNNIKYEPLICQHCGRINLVSQEPYKRRSRVNKHISVDPYVWGAFKMYCSRYGTINNGITMMLYDLNDLNKRRTEDIVNNREIQVIDSQ